MTDYVIAPYQIAIDSREQFPFFFTGYRADAHQGYKPLVIPIVVKGLKTGDYSIVGMEDKVAVERKSLQDAFGTFGAGRERFERELERLSELDFAGVVIEAGWPAILHRPPPHTKFTSKSFFRSVIAWNVRYPKIHFWAAETRSFAERVTLRWLEKCYQYEQERLRNVP